MDEKTLKFIEKAKQVHGDKYDYSKVVYVHGSDKIIITCKEHGDFLQTPYSHYRGRGCLLCGNNKKLLSLENFISKAKLIHGDTHDYSCTEYISSKTKSLIKCKIHGEFWQSPNQYLRGRGKGCPKCSRLNLTLNTNIFIQKAKEIHGNLYDYSKVNYVNTKTTVIISCKIHGEFNQTPFSHLQGHGCLQCSKQARAKSCSDFINESNKIHGNKYDYSKVKYLNKLKKVIIVCNIHGEYLQSPQHHLKGSGCPHCSYENSKYDNEYFIQKAKEIHGNLYDYSKVEYETSKTNITIICKNHGEFKQTPYRHLKGAGCFRCLLSDGEATIMEILKSLKINFTQQYKFTNCVYKRQLPFDFYLSDLNVCIEYDGEQHYRGWHGNINSLEETSIRDSIKESFCKENGIKLIRIKYDVKDIKEYLKQHLGL
jgi:very-short-patch-repair endonuclease